MIYLIYSNTDRANFIFRKNHNQNRLEGVNLMEIENLSNNFLHLLGTIWIKSGSLGPYNTELIFEAFSDIPDENIFAELESLQEKGFIGMSSDKKKLYIEDKGIGQIEYLISWGKQKTSNEIYNSERT